MKKKIIIPLIVLAIIFFGLYIFQGSRFQKTNVLEFEIKKAGDNLKDDVNNSGVGGNAPEIAPDLEIKPADCDNNCLNFKKDNEKKYCQMVCGTETFFEDALDSGGSKEDCDEEKGIQKDYCLKDIAVGNKDFETCSEINDANMKKSCQNRIMEDIIEQQGGQDDSEM